MGCDALRAGRLTPPELLIILAALTDEKIPIQTIASKFTGRFNKGMDCRPVAYVT
jgi:hypothetical protein